MLRGLRWYQEIQHEGAKRPRAEFPGPRARVAYRTSCTAPARGRRFGGNAFKTQYLTATSQSTMALDSKGHPITAVAKFTDCVAKLVPSLCYWSADRVHVVFGFPSRERPWTRTKLVATPNVHKGCQASFCS